MIVCIVRVEHGEVAEDEDGGPGEDESHRDSSHQEMGKSHGGQFRQVLLRIMRATMMVIVSHDL